MYEIFCFQSVTRIVAQLYRFYSKIPDRRVYHCETWQINVSALVTANVYIFAYDLWHTLDVALNRLTILVRDSGNLYAVLSSENDKRE